MPSLSSIACSIKCHECQFNNQGMQNDPLHKQVTESVTWISCGKIPVCIMVGKSVLWSTIFVKLVSFDWMMEVCLDQLPNEKDPNSRLWRSKEYICYFFFNKIVSLQQWIFQSPRLQTAFYRSEAPSEVRKSALVPHRFSTALSTSQIYYSTHLFNKLLEVGRRLWPFPKFRIPVVYNVFIQ